jgi:hypothetical protein
MSDKLDKFLAFGENFDWVTSLVDLHKDLGNGPHHDFHIDRYAGWSANKIRRLLRKQKIQVWGLSYTDALISFRVKKSQARQAQGLLRGEGIPVLGGML